MAFESMRHVFIIGCKGIPAHYGGFETFVDKIVEHRVSHTVRYHVACSVDEIPHNREDFEYNGAHCHCIKWRKIGSARAIAYDLDALDWAIGYAKKQGYEMPIFYVLACRIGPFVGSRLRRIHEIGGVLFVNPDGHEWMRSKWSAPVRFYWKFSERGMVKHADILVCDSCEIERYIRDEYAHFSPKTTYIAYGAELGLSPLADDDLRFRAWLEKAGVKPGGYYLVIGRFVPENNYETMLREFMCSHTKRALILITNENAPLFDELERMIGFKSDSRIRFVGSLYDQDLVRKIREGAFAYLHGHEVGGTNPSLLEALASTSVNLLLDVPFNREVAGESALYWDKEPKSLAALIDAADDMDEQHRSVFNVASTQRIRSRYSWDGITASYEALFQSSSILHGLKRIQSDGDASSFVDYDAEED